MKPSIFLLLLILSAAPASAVLAQSDRPIPYPVIPTEDFEAAVRNGTRTDAGEPGPGYWTNEAEYDIEARLIPESARIEGKQRVRYHNHSPDTLRHVMVHLRWNIHREGAARNREVEVTGGMEIETVAADGQTLGPWERGAAGYIERGTVMYVVLPSPLPPRGTTELHFEWNAEVPSDAPRIGHDEETFFIAYWYPQMAVYDDVRGWVADPYLGDGEFYMGYADYDVAITVPEDWLVGATGVLANPAEVLSEETRSRLQRAAASREVVQVVTSEEHGAGTATARSGDGRHTWRFVADHVRDFAFGTSPSYVWDAVRVDVPGAGAPVISHALYRPDRAAWPRAAEFQQFAIEYLSELVSPYPYPQMTAVEGVIPDGMEFPMITHMGNLRDEHFLFFATFHEVAHNWFPMEVGSDEKSFAWMDEGLITFSTDLGRRAFWGRDTTYSWFPGYVALAPRTDEISSMRHSDASAGSGGAGSVAMYLRPAAALHALEGYLGKDRFWEAYRTYRSRWTGRHPYPYDFFNTFEDVAGEDLDWFWRTMFYETWSLDQRISAVEHAEDAVTVVVEDEGLAPMPAPVRVTYADGTIQERTVPVDVWLEGAREAKLRFPPGHVTEVTIDPDHVYPDLDRADNTWRASPGT